MRSFLYQTRIHSLHHGCFLPITTHNTTEVCTNPKIEVFILKSPFAAICHEMAFSSQESTTYEMAATNPCCPAAKWLIPLTFVPRQLYKNPGQIKQTTVRRLVSSQPSQNTCHVRPSSAVLDRYRSWFEIPLFRPQKPHPRTTLDQHEQHSFHCFLNGRSVSNLLTTSLSGAFSAPRAPRRGASPSEAGYPSSKLEKSR